MSWVVISPVSEQGCMSPEDFEEWDSAAYKALNIHADFAEQYLEVERRLKEDANPDEIIDCLSHTSANVLGMGHGSETAISANDCVAWLHTGNIPNWVRGRVFVMVSCLTGAELGPAVVKKGAAAYFGLQDVGILVGAPDPGYCRFFYASFIGLIQAAISIELGHDVGTAARKAFARWNNEIDYWLEFYEQEKIVFSDGTGIPVDAGIAQTLVTCLVHNRDCFVAYPVVEVSEVSRVAQIVMALIATGAIAGLAYLGSRWEGRLPAPAHKPSL